MHMPFGKTLTVTAVALALGPFAGVAVADTTAGNTTDTRQETQIGTTFALNSHLRANDLEVVVRDGKATLTGTVEDDVSRDLAKQIALGVSGIKNVDNQIEVQEDYVPPTRSGERSFGDVVSDATITASVKSKLLWSKHTEGLGTDVDTVNGKVTLTGTVDNAESKQLATRLAQNTRGVSTVDNRLTLEGAKPSATPSDKGAVSQVGSNISDGWITTKVKSTYMFSSNVNGSDISVSTERGIVTLTGDVASGAERDLAVEFATNVRGVKSVQSQGLNAL